ncbi:hypothetical protein [Campylobacter molothri]|uniref:hypothetical protein n=1 Tax=Campylobacter molothri TaxID=1032242 RepID=UPI0019068DC9|nr:hypothetical protein [Campylobacter sp. 2018MI35]MBZ7929647.1 hypothetical protein [Campylobacter sp. W0067]MBZ7936822.1 hypothetical protein [Campylobacter sp. RM10538]MBZ7962716.1 hypothetical protein [Campylobacter sp. W0049]MBZ7967419.1 hypothetical protein [Campylobacter sp. RM9756]MBZ7969534.1 hypothetical protein [Campylobacter sp. RM3125]MBZ7971265.1 hypothetical protein [Campylobacter sp. RM3124]
MRKLLSVALVACFIGSFAYGKTENNNKSPQVRNSCVDYEIRLKQCNSLPTQYQRQMCRLGLFAACK